MRPLYISPRGRGGVDFGIQNILRSVRRYGAPQAELLQLPEVYNFAPTLIPRGLPEGWWRNFDVIQGRSRVAFALRAGGSCGPRLLSSSSWCIASSNRCSVGRTATTSMFCVVTRSLPY